MKSTLCWNCIKSYGGCPWVDRFEPVKGWKVKKGKISVKVLSCPEFEADLRFYGYKCLSTKEMSDLLGISEYAFLNCSLATVFVMINIRKLPIVLSNGNWFIKVKKRG